MCIRDRDYPDRVKEALDEMVRQAGRPVFAPDGRMLRGVIARHLVLPGQKEDSKAVVAYPVSYTHLDVYKRQLWEVAEGANVGLEADLKKIPIRQETVEICEVFHLNPYHIMSSGSVLAVTEDGPDVYKRQDPGRFADACHRRKGSLL